MTDLTIINANVVLPDEVLVGGAVAIGDGVIKRVADDVRDLNACETTIDAQGEYLIPGLVDLHNDGLEIEIRPRPHAELPLDVAFPTVERRLVGSGVTTEFHAISFLDQKKSNRTVSDAVRRAEYISLRQRDADGALDHHVLHRVDVWSPSYLNDVFESLDRLELGYLSINDHTPGQGQFRDLEKYVDLQHAYAATRGYSEPNLGDIEALMNERLAGSEALRAVYERIASAARSNGTVIASHDDDSAQKVDAMYALGARVAEFPVTLDAAQRARELGMAIVVGAPNIVRGGSQSGNLDAQEMFSLGLADIICADYHAPSLIPSAFRLVTDGTTDLPTAIRALTFNPARAVGLTDRGAIQEGLRADLNIVRLGPSGVPQVRATLKAGRPVFQFGPAIPALTFAA